MPVKTVLSITGVDHDSADLITAAELCDAAGAHLDAVVVGCVPPPPFGEVIGESYSTWSFAWEDEKVRIEARAAALAELVKGKGFQANVQPVYCLQGSVSEAVGERASYADISLIGANLLKDDFLLKRVLDGALFLSPAPVLLAPEGRPVDLAPKTVMVAWNAGLEAGRALRHAMEMLEGAESVHVALVDPRATTYAMGQEPGADVATYLARHGVKTTVDVIAGGGRDVGVVLRKHATEIGADLMVMGAYGHSRLRQWVFGGVTTSMIENPGVPVLLAH